MAAKKGKPRRTHARASHTETPELTTYSIRLSIQERELLTSALQAKGWTPTRFIHQAALEKAAQIHNTARPNSFDFEGFARRLAKQLCCPDFGVGDSADLSGELFPLSEWKIANTEDLYVSSTPAPLNADGVGQLRRAFTLGGGEFLLRVLSECDRLVQRSDALPAPIDPGQFA